MPAAAIVLAYGADRVGLTIAPVVILFLSFLTAGGTFLTLRSGATPDAAGLAAFAAIGLGAFAWLMWLHGPRCCRSAAAPTSPISCSSSTTSSSSGVWCTIGRSRRTSAR
jgi:hypothetical protein